MDTTGLLMLLFGIYLIDSAVKNRKPIELIKQAIVKPGSVREALSNAEGYVPSPRSAFTGTGAVSGGGTGGGSASTWSATATGVSNVIAFAKAQLGKPYVWGGIGTNNKGGGFDCSGLVISAWKKAGVTLPHYTGALLVSSKLEKTTKSALVPGDLVFPFTGHVQLYIGDNKIIEAPGRGRPVRMAQLGAVWQARHVKGNTVTV